MSLVYPQKTVLWQTDDEWYEQDVQKSNTVYNGFFNSKTAPSRLCKATLTADDQPSSMPSTVATATLKLSSKQATARPPSVWIRYTPTTTRAATWEI